MRRRGGCGGRRESSSTWYLSYQGLDTLRPSRHRFCPGKREKSKDLWERVMRSLQLLCENQVGSCLHFGGANAVVVPSVVADGGPRKVIPRGTEGDWLASRFWKGSSGQEKLWRLDDFSSLLLQPTPPPRNFSPSSPPSVTNPPNAQPRQRSPTSKIPSPKRDHQNTQLQQTSSRAMSRVAEL